MTEWVVRLLGFSCIPVVFMFAWLTDDHVLTNGVALGAAYGYIFLAVTIMVLIVYIHNRRKG